MTIRIRAIDRPELPLLSISDRFRTEVAYFMSLPGEDGVPSLAPGEYWISADRAKTWLDEGVFRLVSPLDSASQAEIELSEEQENWLEWMTANGIERIRLET
jgi:hypothetical protein